MIHKIVLIIFTPILLLVHEACIAGRKNEPPSNTTEAIRTRKQKLVNLIAGDLFSIEWMDQSGRKEVIQKEGEQWYYAGMEQVDSVGFNQYLNKLVNTEGILWGNLDLIQNLASLEIVTFYGNSMSAPVSITAFKNPDVENQYLIHSSAYEESIFISDSSGIYRYIFKDLHQFWPDGQ